MNISAIIIQTKPEYIPSLIKTIQESDICDYHMHDDKGKIVVTIEGKDTSEEIKKLTALQAFEYVISADLHMTYSEDELQENIQVLENADMVPKMLNDDDLKPEDIIYKGNLVHKDLVGFSEAFDRDDGRK